MEEMFAQLMECRHCFTRGVRCKAQISVGVDRLKRRKKEGDLGRAHGGTLSQTVRLLVSPEADRVSTSTRGGTLSQTVRLFPHSGNLCMHVKIKIRAGHNQIQTYRRSEPRQLRRRARHCSINNHCTTSQVPVPVVC